MKTIEVIARLQELVDRNGDCEFHLYSTYDDETQSVNVGDIQYDESKKDIFIYTKS